MQKENYEKAKTKQFEKYRAISLYTLLATQIKYDVTGIAVSPEFWLQMKLNDYSVSKSEFKKANNLIVKELNLKCAELYNGYFSENPYPLMDASSQSFALVACD